MTTTASLLATSLLAILGASCGPAPYTIGPEEPPTVALPAPVVVEPERAAPVSAPIAPEDRWIPDGLPRPTPFADHRTWVGDYDCPQGRTALTLRVVDVHGTRVRAVFDFHHEPSDASGQFLVAGTYDEQNGAVALAPGTWIIHPDGYVAVGMVGRVSEDGARFAGRIPSAGCGAFRLHAAR